ncbi:zinc-binding dehydrogenase [Arthrobacter tecti]
MPATVLLLLPKSLPLDHAALVEPTAVAVHDVKRGQVVRGDKVLVIGGGPIGILIASVAREVGADVAVMELDANRRTQTERLGFPALDPRTVDQEKWIHDWTGGAGADVVFEVSGSPVAVLAATSLIKARGTLVVVAIHGTPREVDLQRLFWRELTIVGARVYQKADFLQAIKLLDEGRIPAATLISEIVPLADTQTALENLAAGKAMKILVDVQAGS